MDIVSPGDRIRRALGGRVVRTVRRAVPAALRTAPGEVETL